MCHRNSVLGYKMVAFCIRKFIGPWSAVMSNAEFSWFFIFTTVTFYYFLPLDNVSCVQKFHVVLPCGYIIIMF